MTLTLEGATFEWSFESQPSVAREILARAYVGLLVLDVRCSGLDLPEADARCRAGLAFLDLLDDAEDVEARYPTHRIVALVGGGPTARVDDLVLELGRRGVGAVFRDVPDDAESFASKVVRHAARIVRERRVGKTALCAAGGGITGIYFELGVLKCLDDCTAGAVSRFDLYFGISAGAVVAACLSAGFSPDELMAAIARVPGGRIEPLDLSLLRLAHLNYRDMLRRFREVLRVGARVLRDAPRRTSRETMDELFLDYTALLGPPFHSDRFGELMRRILTQPGAVDDFRALASPLFIGASDQDARQHVLFGAEGHDRVPISVAVQASLSVNPAFSAVRIEGRYFEDGAVTRTSNFVEAIRRGADLLFVVDPFVPYVSPEPGLSNRRGILYNIDQDIRAMSFTRYENTRSWVLRKHPEVSSYTFLPGNRARRLLSVNPMDHRPYLALWRAAYLSTLRRIHSVSHRLRGDLAVHGWTLDTTRADLVAEQLERRVVPQLEDFFPDRRIELRRSPLAGEREIGRLSESAILFGAD